MTQYTWNLRVSSREQDQAIVFARKHQFSVGVPLQFDEHYDQITALEHVLGAIGADVVHGLRVLARKNRLDIEHVEANVQGELNNPLTYLGVVGEEGHPGLQRVQVRVYVSSLSKAEELERIWDEALRRSPLIQTFRCAVDLELTWKLVI